MLNSVSKTRKIIGEKTIWKNGRTTRLYSKREVSKERKEIYLLSFWEEWS